MIDRQLDRLYSMILQLRLWQVAYTLSVGCGGYYEVTILQQLWASGQHIGLDVNFSDFPPASPDSLLLQADARYAPFKPHSFDLVLIRHPDTDRRPMVWETIFALLPFYLRPQGVALITVYSTREYDFLRRHLPPTAALLREQSLKPVNLVGQDRFGVVYRAEG